jgi:hypothetical protein
MDVEPVFAVVCHKASLQNLFACAKSRLDPNFFFNYYLISLKNLI